MGVASTLFLLIGPLTMIASATPDFAKKEKKSCNHCHLKPEGGGERGFRGLYYKGHRFSFKGFVEKAEAKKAGVKPGAVGAASKPTRPYAPRAK